MPTEFKIETIKWSWATNVKNKGVYRDDELIRTKTSDEAIEAIDWLMLKATGTYYYTITVFKDGEYRTYWRRAMPCFGGLVKYLDSHGDKHYMNPYFPRDIYVSYPDGDTIFISCILPQDTRDKTLLGEYLFSNQSPWAPAFGKKESILFRKNHFILTDMNTEPTTLYSLLRYGAQNNLSIYKDWDPRAQILLIKTHLGDPRRLAGQKPIIISGGTWAEGYGYTRPYCEYIYQTNIPVKLSDFKSAGIYPQLYGFKPTYFVKQMEKMFGLKINPDTVKTSNYARNKFEKPLVEAWDYFKKEAEKLGQIPGEIYE